MTDQPAQQDGPTGAQSSVRRLGARRVLAAPTNESADDPLVAAVEGALLDQSHQVRRPAGPADPLTGRSASVERGGSGGSEEFQESERDRWLQEQRPPHWG